MGLTDIVQLVITKDSRPVTRASFGTMLILGPNVNIDNRVAYFSDADSAKEYIVGASSRENKLIDAIFSQSPSVTRIALGAVAATKTLVFTESGTMSAGSISCTINGTVISKAFSASFDGTMTALAVDIAAHAAVGTAVYTTGTNTLVITPNTGYAVGVDFNFSAATGETGCTFTLAAVETAETYTEALTALNASKPDFYGIVTETVAVAKQTLVAAWVEANKKVYFAASAVADIVNEDLDTDTDSIAAVIKNGSYTRTFVFYSALAATVGIEAAAFGKILPLDPGTYTLKFKSPSAIAADTLTTTQAINADAKYVTTLQEVGGINIYAEGKSGSNEYADVIIFIDWLEARITESVFATLAGNNKVPYTTTGIMQVRASLEAPLKIGQNRGGISPHAFDSNGAQIGGYNITVPTLAGISSADKLARTLDNVSFTAWLAGAIHFVKINGRITF
jgi:hypothetical protein